MTSMFSLPASIFEKSRMSLITVSRGFAAASDGFYIISLLFIQGGIQEYRLVMPITPFIGVFGAHGTCLKGTCFWIQWLFRLLCKQLGVPGSFASRFFRVACSCSKYLELQGSRVSFFFWAYFLFRLKEKPSSA